jgi:hypothetical protein
LRQISKIILRKKKLFYTTLFLFCQLFVHNIIYSQSELTNCISIKVRSNEYIIKDYAIYLNRKNILTEIARFPEPTPEMLLKYRPHVKSNYGYNENIKTFAEILNDVSSTISCAKYYEGKIWVGFGFYEGEFSDGYGGIGYYDLSTRAMGVLRHPALINYSVKDIFISLDTVFIQTIGNYECISEVGNGLVKICRANLLASAKVPPGVATIYDKDGGENVSKYYNRPIKNIIADTRFIDKIIPQWPDSISIFIKSEGPDSFMVKAADWEKDCRNHLFSKSRIYCDTTFSMNINNSNVPFRDLLRVIGENKIPNRLLDVEGFHRVVIWYDWDHFLYLFPRKGFSQNIHVSNMNFTLEKGSCYNIDSYRSNLKIIVKDVLYDKIGPDIFTNGNIYRYIKSINFKIVYRDLVKFNVYNRIE